MSAGTEAATSIARSGHVSPDAEAIVYAIAGLDETLTRIADHLDRIAEQDEARGDG